MELMEILTMPVRDVLVGDTGCDIKHDDAALSVDIVAVPQTTELFLPRCIPDVKLNRSKVLLLISKQTHRK